ncbi:MAG: hypothetical protein RLZZ15_4319, partial [Verrucomicrobiota bacterium]
MPEAFVVLAVFVVAVIAWVAAWVRSRDPSLRNAAEELALLRQQEAWLRQRLALAEREHWDADMSAALAAELRLTAQRLAARAPASDAVGARQLCSASYLRSAARDRAGGGAGRRWRVRPVGGVVSRSAHRR